MCELIETTVGTQLFCECFECRGMGWVEDMDAEDIDDLGDHYAIPLIPCFHCNPNGLDT